MGAELEAALAKLDLVDVGRAAGLEFDKLSSSGHGPCRDPFRADDKNPSWLVVADGAGRAVGYQDFAGRASPPKGNLWHFAKLCWPGDSAAALAARLIDMAGTREAASPAPGPEARRKAAAERRKAAAMARRRLEEQYAAQVEMPEPAVRPESAPAAVLERWRDGLNWVRAYPGAMVELCQARGWPLEWANWLHGVAGVSRPLLPWPAARGAERHWAFAVEGPPHPECGAMDTPLADLEQMGYHQVYYIKGDRRWVYVPYMPAAPEKARGEFLAAVAEGYRSAGRAWGERLVQPAPYVVGDTLAPRLAVVLEGQWDAISMYGALGGLGGPELPGVVCFGLRGVENADWLLRYWGRRLRHLAKAGTLEAVWVMGDADRAGAGLYRGEAVPGKVARLSLAERLRELLGCRVRASWPRVPGCKDFNDYLRARAPSVEKMRAMAAAATGVELR